MGSLTGRDLFYNKIRRKIMKKRFTAHAPQSVLRDLGWSDPATYAEVFDFLAERGMLVSICRNYDFGKECFAPGYDWQVDFENTLRDGLSGDAGTWEEAARSAVISCLTIMKENYGERSSKS